MWSRPATWMLAPILLLAWPVFAQPGSPADAGSDYDQRIARLNAAAEAADDSFASARAQQDMAQHMMTLSLWPEALTHAEQARRSARESGDPALQLATDITYAAVLLQLERNAEAAPILLDALQRARTADDQEQEVRALTSLASSYVGARQLEEARDFASQGLTLARQRGDLVSSVRLLSNLGLIAWTAGDAATAAAHIEEALQTPSSELPPDINKTLAIASITLAGTTGDASAIRAQQVIESARRDGSRYMEAFATEQLAHIRCSAGQYEEALALYANAAELFRESDRLGDLSRLHERWAACHQHGGQFELAFNRQQQATELVKQANERRHSATLQAHDTAFRTEQRLAELARLAEEQESLRANLAEQNARLGWLTAGSLLLLVLTNLLWFRNRRLRAQRSAEQQLQQARIHLLANTSHEIRNPAQGLIGLLESQAATDPNKANDPDHLAALGAARMIGHLANDYLDLALLEQGRLRPERDSVCRLPDLLDQLALLSRGFLGAGEQKLFVYRESTLPDRVMIDGERLLQVLLNLVINAAVHGGGQVRLRADSNPEQHQLRFTVEDDGPGLTALDDRLFDPYVRGESANAARGSGLGLAISARIVTAMGGAITARNRQPRGACFELSLPLRQAAPAAADSDRRNAAAAVAPGARALIVDDDRFARLGIRVALESLGCETLELDGRGSLEPVLRSFDPGVVFLDQQLEDTHGLALAQRIREHDRQLGRARRSVVIISGSSQAHSADSTIDGWLVKPASRRALARILAA